MRPYWSGEIRLSLVSVAVQIFPAVSSYKSIPLHELYRKTGERIHHKNVAGENEKEIEREDIIKGYEFKKGEYVTFEKDEIDKVKIPSSDVLEIVQFVEACEIDPLYFERPYFVIPKGAKAEKTFATIREALRESGKYGLGQIVMSGRERLCTLKPFGRGMMLDLIRYKEEVRDADNYFDEIDEVKVAREELDLAKQLIKQKTAKFNPSKFHDHYIEAMKELIDSKVHKRKPHFEKAKSSSKVINLMDALKKSLATKEVKKETKPKKRQRA